MSMPSVGAWAKPTRRRLEMRRVFGLVIGHGRSVGDRAAPADRSGVSENRFYEGRLARVMRTDESNIPEACDIRQCLCPL